GGEARLRSAPGVVVTVPRDLRVRVGGGRGRRLRDGLRPLGQSTSLTRARRPATGRVRANCPASRFRSECQQRRAGQKRGERGQTLVRITIEGSTWTNQRGYGRFLREILSAALRLRTAHEVTLVADTSLPADVALPGATIVRVPPRRAPGGAAAADGRRSLADVWAMSRALTGPPADCLFFPTVYSYVPVWTRAPLVIGIHDVIAERLPVHVFSSARTRRFWSAKVWMAARQATRVMTVSRHAAEGVTQHLRVPASRIS